MMRYSNTPSGSIPKPEMTLIQTYFDALQQATEIVLLHADGDIQNNCDPDYHVCVAKSARYDTLSKESQLKYNVEVCEIASNMVFDDYKDIEYPSIPIPIRPIRVSSWMEQFRFVRITVLIITK